LQPASTTTQRPGRKQHSPSPLPNIVCGNGSVHHAPLQAEAGRTATYPPVFVIVVSITDVSAIVAIEKKIALQFPPDVPANPDPSSAFNLKLPVSVWRFG